MDVLVTKEDAAAVPFSGLSCYCAAVAEMVSAVATTTDAVAVEMIVSGLSCYYSAAAEMVSAVEITTDVAASKRRSPKRGIAYAIPLFMNARLPAVLSLPSSVPAKSFRKSCTPSALFFFWHTPHLSHKHCYLQSQAFPVLLSYALFILCLPCHKEPFPLIN